MRRVSGREGSGAEAAETWQGLLGSALWTAAGAWRPEAGGGLGGETAEGGRESRAGSTPTVPECTCPGPCVPALPAL